jgi:PAS domain S-box-containing protein
MAQDPQQRTLTPSSTDGSAAPGAEPDGLFLRLFELSPVPAVVTRPADHTVLAANARAAEIVGLPPHEAVGRSVTDYYVNPSEQAPLTERIYRDGGADSVRLQIKRHNGEPIWVVASFRLLTWRGEPAVITVFQDISEQLAAEATLKASERRLVAQSDALTDLTARYIDPANRFEDRLRSILEISAQALDVERLGMWEVDEERRSIRCIGLHLRAHQRYESGAIVHRHEAPSYFNAIESDRVVAATDAAADPRTREFDERYLAPNGIGAMLDVPLRHDNTTVGVLCAEHVGGTRVWTVDEQNFAISVGNLIVVAIAEEERRQALGRLAESEARARLIVDTAHDAFIGIDSAGNITAWNAQAETTFGWTYEEAVGRNLAETIIPHAFRDGHNAGMRRFHQTGEAPVVNQRLELRALHRSGREFPVELTITSPMGVRNGFFFGAFLRDISDRRERDAELHRAKESAEAATKAKSEFLANMSHELRTPLNGVLGYAQLLQRDRSMNPTQREALEAISKCGSQLLDLINDVLDLSKIEAGRLDIEEGPTDLSKLITDLTYVVAESASRKGLELTMTVGADVPRCVVLDGRHLRQVLLNLIGNAIKFTAAGVVQLAIGRTDEGALAFEVSDTGMGIEPEAVQAIFEAFVQTKTGAEAGGTGLGLTICNHLIRKMGGELHVDSAPGEGSRFFFTLPLMPSLEMDTSPREAHGAVPLDARLADGEELTALVVDDSTANRRILASLLESAGVQVITAAGGLEAIELARVHRPEVIFMDLKMADLDGLEATRRLRQDSTTAKIPVIAVTASAFGDIRETARDAGCVDYLSKPVRAQSLFAMLQTHLGVRFTSEGDHAGHGGDGPAASERVAGVAMRLRNAIALGDIGDIQELAGELIEAGGADRAMGERINRLATSFDFTGLSHLADSL